LGYFLGRSLLFAAAWSCEYGLLERAVVREFLDYQWSTCVLDDKAKSTEVVINSKENIPWSWEYEPTRTVERSLMDHNEIYGVGD
jgi:hypothetical protein